MQSVLDKLVLPKDRLVLLFTPPFDKTGRDPGYIQGYLPGIRENGGQYTHAAIWNTWAFSLLGDGEHAGELFSLLNPIYHSDTEEKADEYRVEPYVICADIYSRPPYMHRGGWTWYTGSAAWMHRLGVTGLLGFHKVGDSLRIDPTIPPQWEGYSMEYKFKSSRYKIVVSNPSHIAHGVKSVKLDGTDCPDRIIPLVDDGKEHRVEVGMGE
jgi:cyclic beta-1,2-glucan synthetase